MGKEFTVRLKAMPEAELDEVFTLREKRTYQLLADSIHTADRTYELQRSCDHRAEPFIRVNDLDVPMVFCELQNHG